MPDANGPVSTAIAADVAAVTRWLVSSHARALTLEQLVAGLAEEVSRAGVPLWRIALSLPTKHPELFVRNLLWWCDRGLRLVDRPHAITTEERFRNSPAAAVIDSGAPLRCRLAGDRADLRFPLCRDLAGDGGTDYFVQPLRFTDGATSFVSWASREPGGFSDAQLDLLEGVLPALTLRLELEAAQFTMRSLLQVYLGPNAAARVLAGAFRRGGGESISAAIWFCDMRAFTSLAARTPAADVVAILDRFFEAVAGPIAGHGGEVLKFIGDAVLAIFPLGESDRAATCAHALAAAEHALAGVAALNAERAGDRPLDLGIALHIGEVMYGNIGAHDRLDFTVIGAAVNEASRIEGLCGALAVPLLMSRDFVGASEQIDAVSLGHHALKGVDGTREVFTLPSVVDGR